MTTQAITDPITTGTAGPACPFCSFPLTFSDARPDAIEECACDCCGARLIRGSRRIDLDGFPEEGRDR
jgi:hypothetical protein